MSTWRERERIAIEQARRWPVSFGLQFFFGILGCVFVAQNAVSVSPDFLGIVAKAGVGAIIFTVVFRRRPAPPSPGSPAA